MEVENNNTEQQEQASTFTQEQVDELVAAKVAEATKGLLSQDKVNQIVQDRLAKEKKKQEEAEKLARMTQEEREKEILRQEREKYEADLKEFRRLQEEFTHSQLVNETSRQLANDGLDIAFSEFLVGADAEATKNNLDKFKATWQTALDSAIEARLKGSTPPKVPINDTKATKNPKDMDLNEFIKWKAQEGE